MTKQVGRKGEKPGSDPCRIRFVNAADEVFGVFGVAVGARVCTEVDGGKY